MDIELDVEIKMELTGKNTMNKSEVTTAAETDDKYIEKSNESTFKSDILAKEPVIAHQGTISSSKVKSYTIDVICK